MEERYSFEQHHEARRLHGVDCRNRSTVGGYVRSGSQRDAKIMSGAQTGTFVSR